LSFIQFSIVNWLFSQEQLALLEKSSFNGEIAYYMKNNDYIDWVSIYFWILNLW
jgi:hypothetical protein